MPPLGTFGLNVTKNNVKQKGERAPSKLPGTRPCVQSGRLPARTLPLREEGKVRAFAAPYHPDRELTVIASTPSKPRWLPVLWPLDHWPPHRVKRTTEDVLCFW